MPSKSHKLINSQIPTPSRLEVKPKATITAVVPGEHKSILGLNNDQWLTNVWFPLTTGLLVFIAGTLLILYFTKFQEKLKIKILGKLTSAQFNQFSALYCERVPDDERVPPSHFRSFFGTEHSVSSERDFKRRIKNSKFPLHLMLVAFSSGEILGFLKAIYIPTTKCFFIAYLVSSKGQHYEERNVTQALISQLEEICRNTSISSIAFEICEEEGARHLAKSRLFRHYGTSKNIKFQCVDAIYYQPEICSFESGECKIFPAKIHIAFLNHEKNGLISQISTVDYLELIKSIYLGVYLKSFQLTEPSLGSTYEKFLMKTVTTIASKIKKGKLDLK